MWQSLVFWMLVFTGIGSNAQSKVYKGVLRDKASNELLAYVNIGILNKNVGTVSDANGNFQLILDEKYDTETLKISMIGYQPLTFKVADFKAKITENQTMILQRDVAELKEIVVRNTKQVSHILGNELDHKTVSAGFVNNLLGNEIGMVVKMKKRTALIAAFHAIVDYNNYEELKFRLNFYDLKDGLPNNTLLQENIIVTSHIDKGRLTVDLTPYDIVVKGDFFVSIELIENLGEGGLHFRADYSGPQIITRSASQGKWNKQDDISFGFSVTAKY